MNADKRVLRLKKIALLPFFVAVVGGFLIFFGENTPISWITPTFKCMLPLLLLSSLLTLIPKTFIHIWDSMFRRKDTSIEEKSATPSERIALQLKNRQKAVDANRPEPDGAQGPSESN